MRMTTSKFFQLTCINRQLKCGHIWMFQQDDDAKRVEWIKQATIKLLGFPKVNICEVCGLRLEATSVLEKLKCTLLFN